MKNLTILILLFLFGCSILWWALENPAGDFIQFQAAHLAFRNGLNPYDPKVMLEIQRNLLIGATGIDNALMMWCLPWVLIFLCPIGFYDEISTSLFQWNLIAVILVLFSISILLFNRKFVSLQNKYRLLVLTAICSSAPLIDVFRLHQSTPIFIAALVLFLAATNHRSEFYAGICASICLIKPHLFIFIFICWLFNLDSIRRLASGICGILIGVLVIAIACEMKYPGSSALWLDTLKFSENQSSSTIARINWKGANIFGVLRNVFDTTHPFFLLIPSISFWIATALLLLTKRLSINLSRDLAWIVPASLLTSPYGWFYDQALCIVSIYLILQIAINTPRFKLTLYLTILLNFMTAIFYLYFATMHHDLWWYPLGCILIYYFARPNNLVHQHK